MDINNLQKTIQAFCTERDWDRYHDPKELAIGMSTEANELLALFRFLDHDQITQIMVEKKEAIEDELMDVLFFVLRFAQRNDIDIALAFDRKMEKNRMRYPVELVKGKNKKYDEYKNL